MTGKFVVETVEDADRDRGSCGSRSSWHRDSGRMPTGQRSPPAPSGDQLRRLNSEFAHYVPAERQLPEVVLRPTGDPGYFPAGVKHRYTRPPGARPTKPTQPSP